MLNRIINSLPFKKKLETGEFESFFHEEEGVAVTSWKDSKMVKFITNYSPTDIDPDLHYVRRGNTQPTAMPLVAVEYRKKMVHVDAYEKNRKKYNSRRKVKRWWMILFFFFIRLHHCQLLENICAQ